MKLKPIITEKTMSDADKGRYTFEIDRSLNKFQIKKLVEKIFKVHVTRVRVMNISGELRKTIYGRKRIIQPGKKAIVELKEKEKIDVFETKGK